jgi:hypothetical protein
MKLREHLPAVIITIVVAIAFATGPPWWWKYLGSNSSASGQAGVIRFRGGCSPFTVYAQNRWQPYGAAIRTAPSPTSKQIASKDPNQLIAVDGWVHGTVSYLLNVAPFNNDVWFHLADGSGWVSFAGIRAQTTSEDPTGFADGGPPVPLKSQCQGNAQ